MLELFPEKYIINRLLNTQYILVKGDEDMAQINGKWIHMVGIAGAGMSGIAKVLCEQGNKISGSDLVDNSVTDKLKAMGIDVFLGHSALHLEKGVDLVVVSSAIPAENVELQVAKSYNIPVIKRGQMLAQIVNQSKGIAVAGAHGKTTTTAMLFTILEGCQYDPSFIVGGEIQGTSLNAKLGRGDYFIIESDESDASFLELQPYIAIVTNIEDDHLDFYKSFSNIQKAFAAFLGQINPKGFAVYYADDHNLKEIIQYMEGNFIDYGENLSAKYRLHNWKPRGIGSTYDLYIKEKFITDIELSVPGQHNALNSLACIAVAMELGLDILKIKQEIKKYKGTKRRFEIIEEKGNVIVVDDYAHHPTEIRATLEAARNYHPGRIIVIFQPHRYSRTKMLGSQFGAAFIAADLTIISDVYAAGEIPLDGVSGEIIYQSALQAGCNALYIPELSHIEAHIKEELRENDLIITMGAGDIWTCAVNIARYHPASQAQP